jgi:competence protein ComEC
MPVEADKAAEWGTIARHPAVAAAVCFVAGILAHEYLPLAPPLWLACLAALLAIATATRRYATLSSAAMVACLFLSGVCVAQLEAFFYRANHVGHFATDKRRLAQLELFIDNEPRILSDPYSQRPMPPKQVVTARVTRVRTWDGWYDACGDVLVQIAQPHPRLALGQTVRVLGMLERPAPANNPGQFDWARYYRDQRILASVHIPMAQNIQILREGDVGALATIRQQSRRLLAAGFTAENSLDHALLRALLLGDSDPEMRDVQEQFKKIGTSHHLAISGMHIAVLGGFVYGVCRVLRVRPRRSLAVGLVFVLIYGVAALPSPPVVRSILLCGFVGLGMMSGRKVDMINLLAASVIAMLAWKPLDAFNPGFQLSFVTVLGLMLFASPLSAWFASLRRDELVVPAPAWQARSLGARAGEWAESLLARTFAAAVVAWMVSMPLILFHFEQANWWAVPGSILMAPVVFLALVGGLLKVLLTLLLPSLAGTWATIAAAPVAWMRWLVDWLAELPFATTVTPGLPLWGLVLLLALYWVFWRVPCRRPRLTYCVRAVPVLSLTAAVLLPIRAIERAVAPEELRLTLLAVGAGQAAVLETPAGRTVMIDAGSGSLSDPLRKCIAPYLRTRGTTQVETMLLTHGDYDHVSAAVSVAQVYDVREVLTGGRFRAHAADNPPAEAMLRELDALDLPPRIVRPGERIPLGTGIELEILWPPTSSPPESLSSNDSCIVARLSYAGRSILITGDIEEVAQRELIRRYSSGELRADILIAPHHGSSESTTAAFVRAVQPSHIVSSNDRSLTGKQRQFDRIVRGIPLYRTNECGAVTIRIRHDGSVTVDRFLNRH